MVGAEDGWTSMVAYHKIGVDVLKQQRKAKAVELRAQGQQYAPIGRAVGVSDMQAIRYVREAVAEFRGRSAEAIEFYVARQCSDLDALRDSYLTLFEEMGVVGQERAVLAFLEVEKRRAKLLGLDAVDQEASLPDNVAFTIAIDSRRLADSESD